MMLSCRSLSCILLLAGSSCWSLLVGFAVGEQQWNQSETPVSYGVDISYPMHHIPVSTNYAWLPHNVNPALPVPDKFKNMAVSPLANAKERYDEYINGCVDYYNNKKAGSGERCLENERERVEMTLRQPQSMRNYTHMGFTKIRAPEKVYQLLRDFWEANKNQQKPERWAPANIYTNHWVAPSYMVSVEDASLDGGGYVLKQHIWNAARDTIEEWTGYKQAECSLYGIRVYKEGAMLAPHVDRLPLVSSAIINVDQDVDEPWPLEVIGHDGMAHNVTMEPGDLVLYESHSVIHGRQFPLKGRFMANVFIHFEPIGPIGGAIEYTGDLPPYVIPGSLDEGHWRMSNPNGHKIMGNRAFTTGSTDAHYYAVQGESRKLRETLDQFAHTLNQRDANGWTPLHEAVRNGDRATIEILLERGAELNARAGVNEEGGTPLWMAIQYHGEDHEAINLLKSWGAVEHPPFVHQEL